MLAVCGARPARFYAMINLVPHLLRLRPCFASIISIDSVFLLTRNRPAPSIKALGDGQSRQPAAKT